MARELRSASDTEQFKYCTEKLKQRIERDPEFAKKFTPRQLEQIKAGEPRISGLTWHHNEVPGKMQLVSSVDHEKCSHTGGCSIWGGGSDPARLRCAQSNDERNLCLSVFTKPAVRGAAGP